MGSRGPVPKRSEDRKRRNKVDVSEVVVELPPVVVPEMSEAWDDVAKRLWVSLTESAQARFYEPSDWGLAFFLMDEITRYRSLGRVSGQSLTAILGGLTGLLVSEGDRRRVGLELGRASSEVDDDARAVEVMAEWKERMGS